jgi:hypothetical protein
MIKDINGDDVQMFRKEDERNRLRKDSSFYYNGYWEVFEFDDALRETRFRAASGVSSVSKYDVKDRLNEYYRMEGNDTLESQKYEWENGRLVRMTANGVVRNYFYGKTLRDPVRVEPSDEGFNYHRGYNGTAGKIPEEGTDDYETFSRNPYGHVHFGEIEEEEEYEQGNISFAAKKTSGSLNVLAKSTTSGCVNKSDGFPAAQCARLERKDMTNDYEAVRQGILYGYKGHEDTLSYGSSDFKLSLKYRCNCNNEIGKYQLSFEGKTVNEKIEVMQSTWRYNNSSSNKYSINNWYERCWRREDLQMTYVHETKHIINARRIAATLNSRVLKFDFNTKKECEEDAKVQYKILETEWDEWSLLEKNHLNPSSPKYSGPRPQYACN